MGEISWWTIPMPSLAILVSVVVIMISVEEAVELVTSQSAVDSKHGMRQHPVSNLVSRSWYNVVAVAGWSQRMVIKGRCQRVAYKINSNGPIDMKHLTTYLAYLGFVATQVYQEWCKLRSSLPAKPYDRPKLRKRIPQYQTAWLSESESRALLRPEYTPMCAVSVKYLDLYVDW